MTGKADMISKDMNFNHSEYQESSGEEAILDPPVLKSQKDNNKSCLASNDLQCIVCSKFFVTSTMTQRHFENEHGNTLFECRFCDLTFILKRNLQKHHTLHHCVTKLKAASTVRECLCRKKGDGMKNVKLLNSDIGKKKCEGEHTGTVPSKINSDLASSKSHLSLNGNVKTNKLLVDIAHNGTEIDESKKYGKQREGKQDDIDCNTRRALDLDDVGDNQAETDYKTMEYKHDEEQWSGNIQHTAVETLSNAIKKASKDRTLENSRKAKSQGERLWCKTCRVSFKNKMYLRRHIHYSLIHKQRTSNPKSMIGRIPCSNCNSTFASKASLRKHQRLNCPKRIHSIHKSHDKEDSELKFKTVRSQVGLQNIQKGTKETNCLMIRSKSKSSQTADKFKNYQSNNDLYQLTEFTIPCTRLENVHVSQCMGVIQVDDSSSATVPKQTPNINMSNNSKSEDPAIHREASKAKNMNTKPPKDCLGVKRPTDQECERFLEYWNESNKTNTTKAQEQDTAVLTDSPEKGTTTPKRVRKYTPTVCDGCGVMFASKSGCKRHIIETCKAYDRYRRPCPRSKKRLLLTTQNMLHNQLPDRSSGSIPREKTTVVSNLNKAQSKICENETKTDKMNSEPQKPEAYQRPCPKSKKKLLQANERPSSKEEFSSKSRLSANVTPIDTHSLHESKEHLTKETKLTNSKMLPASGKNTLLDNNHENLTVGTHETVRQKPENYQRTCPKSKKKFYPVHD